MNTHEYSWNTFKTEVFLFTNKVHQCSWTSRSWNLDIFMNNDEYWWTKIMKKIHKPWRIWTLMNIGEQEVNIIFEKQLNNNIWTLLNKTGARSCPNLNIGKKFIIGDYWNRCELKNMNVDENWWTEILKHFMLSFNLVKRRSIMICQDWWVKIISNLNAS